MAIIQKFGRASSDSGPVQWAFERNGDVFGVGAEIACGPHDTAFIELLVAGELERLLPRATPLDPRSLIWHLPVPRPGKFICLGLNYAAHAAEGGNAEPEYPSFFFRGASSLIPHAAPLVLPTVSDKLDFEAELAVVIGKRSRHLSQSNASDAVAAYTCFNDGTLRDYQRKTAQWTIGKNFDGTGPFGPWMVPAHALPRGAKDLSIESRLNGRVMQQDNTSNMLVSVERALIILTEVLTLEVGDVVAMGTPSGVGYARKPAVFMREGDQIEVSIEGIGTLSNRVVRETT